VSRPGGLAAEDSPSETVRRHLVRDIGPKGSADGVDFF
jgi:hypothetical protein